MPRIIAGEWGGRTIQVPRGGSVRPTTDRMREAWMSALAPAIPGARVLDLFAGSGALGLECLSRGASEAVFVEQARGSLRVLRTNLSTLGAQSRARVVAVDVHRYLAGPETPRNRFDVALADPPYEQGHVARLVQRFRSDPFATELWLEHSVREPVPDAVPDRQRRYGDALLSTLLGAPPDESHP